MSESPVIERQAEQHRYVAFLDGEPIAFAAYRDAGANRVFTTTVTNPAHGGRGYAGLLVEAAFKDALDEERMIVPQCSYVEHYLRTHPEWEQAFAEKGLLGAS